MGVPKFFRWVAERFPTVITPFKDMPPLVDNLYLDMNGIIHNCTHPNDVDAKQKTPTEKEIATAMFAYLEKLFNAIQPRKHFFLAVDGVAPRAKMNQQRQRRFRAAFDMAAAREEALLVGEELPDEADVFDSNCITPGTEFMVKMHEHFKYFLAMKIASDTAWQNCKIIFSGHDTPGEGEHKIVDFIRRRKMEPGYCPNETHCMYGLDADLVMLSLATHEPHFLLLREVVTFGGGLSRKEREIQEAQMAQGLVADPSFAKSDEFVLFHVNLLRDFLEMEVQLHLPTAEQVSANFDFEYVIDDFVLMCFLIGNDFLPSVPTIGIGHGSMHYIIQWYMEKMLATGRTLTVHGDIQWPIFEEFIKIIGSKENEMIAQMQREEHERRKQVNKMGAAQEAPSALLTVANAEAFKAKFYEIKHGFPQGGNPQSPEMQSLVQHYVEGLMWVWNYYYQGPTSWNWYFPHHYAPMASDLVGLDAIAQGITFNASKPFLPHQQLLSVLPPYSYRLLPEAYWPLLRSNNSPLASYFPTHLEIDREGTRAPWEGIVLIPFIEEATLLDAYNSVQDATTDVDKMRNTAGNPTLLQYDAQMQPITYSNSVFQVLRQIQVRLSSYQLPKLSHFVPKLCPGVRTGTRMLEGFATLASKKHLVTPVYETGVVTIFGGSTRRESMLLDFDAELERQHNDGEVVGLQQAAALVGTEVMVGFPHYSRARVSYVTDGHSAIRAEYDKKGQFVGKKDARLSGLEIANYARESAAQRQVLKCKLGLTMEASTILVYVYRFTGMAMGADNRIVRQFSAKESCYPFPLVAVFSALNLQEDDRYVERAGNPDDAGVGSRVLYIGPPPKNATSTTQIQGSMGVVTEVHGTAEQGRRFAATLRGYAAPLQIPVALRHFTDNQAWTPLGVLAATLGVGAHALGRVTGRLQVSQEFGAHEIGMCLKMTQEGLARVGYAKLQRDHAAWYEHRNIFARMEDQSEALGYHMNLQSTRRESGRDRGSRGRGGVPGLGDAGAVGPVEPKAGRWYFSKSGVALITEYVRRFRPLLKRLEEGQVGMSIDPSSFLTEEWHEEDATAVVEGITKFIEESGIMQKPMINASEDAFTGEQLSELETFLNAHTPVPTVDLTVKNVKGKMLYFPIVRSTSMGQVIGLSLPAQQLFYLGARVVNCRAFGAVPLGAQGTVVRLMGREAEVLYDQEFLGGTTMNGRLQTTRGAVTKLAALLVLHAEQ